MDEITEEHGKALVALARKTIADRLSLEDLEETDPALSACRQEPCLQEQRGTFVTLKIKGQLRGCMGCLTPTETILDGVQRNAINAAFNDPRFPELTDEELEQAEIEVSILTEPQTLEYTDGNDLLARLRPKVDGVILQQGYSRATFLPQVWEQLPKTEDFLAHLCRKAGLPADAWQSGELEVSTYQVQYFHEQK